MNIRTVKKGRGRNRRLKDPFRVRAGRFASQWAFLLAIVLAVPVAGAAVWKGYQELKQTPYLAITEINVTGLEKVSREEAVELSGIREGQNLLSISTSEAVKRLGANPWVASAEVDRDIPGTVNIVIRQRRPIALVKLDAIYVMDSNGVIFKKYSPDDSLDLPVVTGLTKEGLAGGAAVLEGRLLELIATLTHRSGFNITGVSEINVDRSWGLSIYTLDEGVRLDVGTDRFEEKLASFERILRARGGVLKGIEAFDLNNHHEVIVRFTTDVVKEGGEADGQKG